jgi:hypothetical protein
MQNTGPPGGHTLDRLASVITPSSPVVTTPSAMLRVKARLMASLSRNWSSARRRVGPSHDDG